MYAGGSYGGFIFGGIIGSLVSIITREIIDSLGITDSLNYELLQLILVSISDDMGMVDSLSYVETQFPKMDIQPHFYDILNNKPTGLIAGARITGLVTQAKPKIMQPSKQKLAN